jgi:hypothetical protein
MNWVYFTVRGLAKLGYLFILPAIVFQVRYSNNCELFSNDAIW